MDVFHGAGCDCRLEEIGHVVKEDSFENIRCDDPFSQQVSEIKEVEHQHGAATLDLVLKELCALRESQNRVEGALMSFTGQQSRVAETLTDVQNGVYEITKHIEKELPSAVARGTTRKPTLLLNSDVYSMPPYRSSDRSRCSQGSGEDSDDSVSFESALVETGHAVPTLPDAWPATITLREVIRGSKGVDRMSKRMSHTHSLTFRSPSENSLITREWCSVMLHPDNKLKLFLDTASIITMTADLTLIPVVLAWELSMAGTVAGFSTFSAAYWSLDIFVNFNAGFYREDSEVEMRPCSVARRYCMGWFTLDFGIVMCDWISLIAVFTQSEIGTDTSSLSLVRFAKASRLLRIFGLLRMFRLARITDDLMERHLTHEIRLGVRILLILLVVVWVSHIISCLWYAIGSRLPTDTGTRWTDARVTIEGIDYPFASQNRFYQYTSSLHWSIAQMTLGSIDVVASNTAERLFNILMLLVGLLFSCSLVSTLSTTMIDLRMSVTKQNKMMRKLRQFLRQHDVHSRVSSRVTQQVSHRLKQKDPLTEADVEVLSMISSSLRSELRHHMFKEHLATYPIFDLVAGLNLSTSIAICNSAVEFRYLQSGDDLFPTGAACDCAYYVVDGSLTYVQEPDTAPVHKTTSGNVVRGAWLCEAALWTKWVHVGSAHANSTSQIMTVNADRMLKCIQRHRPIQDLVETYAASYHSCLITAVPPKRWPSDLHVEDADFGAILVKFEGDLQVMLSTAAYTKIVKQGMFRFLFDGLEGLRQQILNNEIALWVNASHQAESVCRTLVFCISEFRMFDGRATDQLLVQLAEGPHNSPLIPTCSLPSTSLMGRTVEEATVFLLEKLQLGVNSLEMSGRHAEVEEVETSSSVIMRARVFKDVHSVTMLHQLDAPLVMTKGRPKRLRRFLRQGTFKRRTKPQFFAEDTPRPSIGTQGTSCSDSDSISLHQMSQRTEVFRISSAHHVGLYAWLSREEMIRLRSHDGEAAAWLGSLDLPEVVRLRS